MARERPIHDSVLGWTHSREQRRGLRPRDAAVLITLSWLFAIDPRADRRSKVVPDDLARYVVGPGDGDHRGLRGRRPGDASRQDHRLVPTARRAGLPHRD